jgi:hypothetical protein
MSLQNKGTHNLVVLGFPFGRLGEFGPFWCNPHQQPQGILYKGDWCSSQGFGLCELNESRFLMIKGVCMNI